MLWLWQICGYLSLGLAIAGFTLPVLPGTPFILLAAWCFYKGKHPMAEKMRQHAKWGPMIRNWQAGHGIRRRIKWIAILSMWTSGLISCWMTNQFFLWILIPIILTTVSLWLWRLPEPPQ